MEVKEVQKRKERGKRRAHSHLSDLPCSYDLHFTGEESEAQKGTWGTCPGPHSQAEIQVTPRLMLVTWPHQAVSCESTYEGDILHCSEPSARLGVIWRLSSRRW